MIIIRNIFIFLLFCVLPLMAFPSIEYQYGFSLSNINSNTANEFTKPGLSPFFGIKVNYFEFNKFRISSSIGYLEIVGITEYYVTDEIRQYFDTIDYATRYNILYVNTVLEYVLKNPILSPSILIGPHLDYLLYSTLDSKFSNQFNGGLTVGLSAYKQITNHLILHIGEMYNTFFNDFDNTFFIQKSRYHFTTFVGFTYNIQ